MITFRPFRAIRPSPENAQSAASRPYDVLDSEEARKEATGNKNSFLRVIKPEIDLPESTNVYDETVYQSGKKTFNQLIADGIFQSDLTPSFYIYRLTMDGRTQTGIVGCCHFEEYYDGRIKKHELTRTAKENDRVKHVETLEANAEPVFFSYRGQREIDQVVEAIIKNDPVYDFFADDGIRHELWVCEDQQITEEISKQFQKLDSLYVADGHHRTAAAARVGKKLQENNPLILGMKNIIFLWQSFFQMIS